MSIKRKFFAFKAKHPPRAPLFENDPDWMRAFAEFVEQTSRLDRQPIQRAVSIMFCCVP